MSMPDSVRFASSVSRISPMPPPNSVLNISRKFSLIASKASPKRCRDSVSISWIAFSVSRIESSRSCRCAFRKS